MSDETASVEVPSQALRDALRRMARLGRRTPGPATWRLGPQGLNVAWMGMSQTIEGAAEGQAVVVVTEETMRGLARVASWPSVMTVAVAGSELMVGPLTVEAEARHRPPPQLLPLNAEPCDLLRLHVREPAARLAEAGLEEAVAHTLARLDASCAAASQSLRWTGVTAEELRAWLLSRLGPAEPPREVVVVEPSGQVRLFEDS